MFRLDDKIVLVTGGSRGIGRACAEALAGLGATVLVNYRSGEAEARSVAENIAATGGRAEICAFDVADTKATEAAMRSTDASTCSSPMRASRSTDSCCA
jgi:3-oxoacyl-[acyl-carrier protein] reductase